VELELPKRQHKFLDKRAIEEILESTGSLVLLPPASDLSEKVVIRGENMSNVQALGLVVVSHFDTLSSHSTVLTVRRA
jgi:hypothetical protein